MPRGRSLAETLSATNKADERDDAAQLVGADSAPERKKLTADVPLELWVGVKQHEINSLRPIGALMAALVKVWLRHPELDEEVYLAADEFTKRFRRGGQRGVLPQQPGS